MSRFMSPIYPILIRLLSISTITTSLAASLTVGAGISVHAQTSNPTPINTIPLVSENPLARIANANAPEKTPIEVKLTALKVVKEKNGREKFESADEAKPGDTLEYRLTYKNISTTTVNEIVADLPIPQNTVFVANSAKPAKAMATTEMLGDNSYAALPLTRNETDTNGKRKKVAIPLNEYRSLRWTVNVLAPGKSESFSARVEIPSIQEEVPQPQSNVAIAPGVATN